MNWRHRRSAGVGMSAVDDRTHAESVVNKATPQHTLDYWRETEEPAASLNDPLHYRQHEVNLVTAYHHSGRHWRQPRRGCRRHIPPIFWLGGRQREYPRQYYFVLLDIADQYWLPSVRSASSRFHSAIRRHQFASVRQADSRLTRLVPQP